ncbi:MAG TPA: membrane protein insertase YidC [Ignavibacteriaceae bacterium]|nr:membrane protein insertase YidC [Ignavibacteriaceae bacterium]
MDKQTTLAFILIGAILLIWLYITAPDPSQAPPQQQTQDTTDVAKEQEEKIVDDSSLIEQDESIFQEADQSLFAVKDKPEEIVRIENDVAVFEFSTIGGNFNRVFLKQFNNWYSAGEGNGEVQTKHLVQLIHYSLGGSYDVAFVSSEGRAVNTGKLAFNYEQKKYLHVISGTDSVRIDFTYNIDDTRSLTKSYLFYGDKYIIKNDIRFKGFNNLISNNSFDLVWNNGIRFVEENSVDESTFSDAIVYYGDEAVDIDASSPVEKVVKEFRGRVDWVAVRNKYFAAIIKPENKNNVEGAYVEGTREVYPNEGVREFYNARLIIPFKNTQDETYSFTIFLGPIDYDILSEMDKSLRSIINFGGFFGLKFIVRPIAEYILLPLFKFLHAFIPNYGIVIIVFSLIIKIVVYPLTKSSYRSMKKMQALQPKIAEIKEKYKDDAQKMNKETMKLYSTYGVNPAGGCLPILLQMPIFIALWGLFQAAIDLRQQPFFWWIQDLSRPDVIYDLGFKMPLFGIQQISGLAILMGLTTFVQQKMTMKDPKQAALVYIMPVMLTILFMTFPSGLNLYYFMFNLFSIAQQYYINHQTGDVELVPVANPKKKTGFMQRLMEQAEQQSKQQQKKKK